MVCLLFRPSKVVRYYIKYNGSSLGLSPPILFIVRGASSQSLREQTEIVGIDAFLKKKDLCVKWWATFYLDLHYIIYTIYSSGSRTDLVCYQEGGRQCCFSSLSALLFDKLGSSPCCHWTAENVDHILEFGDKITLDSLQEGLLPDIEMLSVSNLPFAVHWIAESSKAVDLLQHRGPILLRN